MTEVKNDIKKVESAIRGVLQDGTSLKIARLQLRKALQRLAQIEQDDTLSLAETFNAIADLPKGPRSRDLGIVAIRVAACEKLFPSGSTEKWDRHIVRIVEKGCSDLLGRDESAKRKQTYEKLTLIVEIHSNACAALEQLKHSFTNFSDLTGRRQTIMNKLNQGPTKNYLAPFGYEIHLSSISSHFSLIADVIKAQGNELQESLQGLLESVKEDIDQLSSDPTFIVQDYILPFFRGIEKTAQELEGTLAEEFSCSISGPVSPHHLEKKYPLHVIGSEIQIFVPLTNVGPGAAQDVQACCVGGEHCEVLSEETRLGNVPRGAFMLTLLFEVIEETTNVELVVEVRWHVVGDPERHSLEFQVVVEAQRSDLDWDTLSLQQPYSLDVAYGKDFYGRKDTMQRILRCLAPQSMQSCYITGQKRVGKSSLARAVESGIKEGVHLGQYKVLYLECGEIRYSTGEDTLGALGSQLEKFLAADLPRSEEWPEQDYTSSLAPLNKLLEKLYTSESESRFVVIVDEFDEINETLYLYGEQANTFFLNIRTLASKRNIAFILVGAERMPFVMAAQGEKLNRFARESLDSFDRNTEWEDYLNLVRTPIRSIAQAHESALYSLFDFTNGHPYFTKMLCSTVYECAVEAKDAEVTRSEIEKAARRVVRMLATNAFAHYWRDGIRGDSKEIEIISTKRCRVLLAWARTARARKPCTCEEIQTNVHSVSLNSTEVLPVLEDFCRRGVFKESEGEYLPTVKLFADWLIESGFSMLVSNQLGDELAAAKQLLEDTTYVKADEIVEITQAWGLYQGREVTTEQVRAWLDQVESNQEQRLLFKMLQNLKFFHDSEVRERFVSAHTWLQSNLPFFARTSRAKRRDDIFISYLGGEGKSGAHYAGIYAQANDISSKNVIAPDNIGLRFAEMEPNSKFGLVIVDDMIGTGQNLIDGLTGRAESFAEAGIGSNVPLSVVVLCGTETGERRVRKYLSSSCANSDLEVCEVLEDKHFAFGNSLGFWDSEDQKNKAKSLVTDLGAKVQKRKPLGYGGQGLLLTFSRNCPNNSLPILHGRGKALNTWRALFPRTVT